MRERLRKNRKHEPDSPAMKRILLVTNIFPPTIGGPATFIDKAAHELVSKGWQVTVVCSTEKISGNGDEHRPFTVRRVSTANRYVYEVMVRLRLFWEILWHRRIFVNGLESYFAQVNRFVGRKYFLKIVGDSVWETLRNRGQTACNIDEFQASAGEQARWQGDVRNRNLYVIGASRVVVPSQYLRRMVMNWGVAPERVTVILNGVEPALVASLPPQRRIDGKLRIAFVGRLTNWKGVETILLAVRSLDEVSVTVAGEGPQYPALLELARQLGVVNKVKFAGRLARSQVSELMRSSDVLVLTSLYEGLSHTLIESMAAGLPCIASACGGNSETVQPEVTGLLIPPQDPEALEAALRRLRDDEEFRHRLAGNAWQRAQDFSLTRTVAEMAELIDRSA